MNKQEKESINQLRQRMDKLQSIADRVNPLEERVTKMEKMATSEKEVLTLEEAAIYMGVSLSQVYKMTSTQSIPHYKPRGKMCYFNRKELNDWLMQNHSGPIVKIRRNG